MEWSLIEDAKFCFLPDCRNNSKYNIDITFVAIRKSLKQEWCCIVGRNCPKRQLYCCERHLNLEKDLENYWQWKLQGTTPKMSATAILRNVNIIHSNQSTSVAENLSSSTSLVDSMSMVDTKQDTLTSTSTVKRPIMVDTGVQVMAQTKDKETNYVARKPNFKKRKLKIEEVVASGSDNVVQESASCEIPSSSGATTEVFVEKYLYGRNHITKMIEGNPKAYIGLPKNMFWLVDHIAKKYKINKLYIFMTLFKLKQNDTLGRIKDEFELSAATVQNYFYKTTIILASYFQNLIFWPDAIQIKKNLPLSFKIRYSNVQCIIDCFEIEIEHPSDPKKQASTWSQYKSCNTVKYLIGCTPNGLVNFVSQGYGGRISDKAIVEKSGFVDILPPNSVIMADWGFKEVQTVLKKKNVTLLRPPSVSSKDKPTKKDVIETKVIASLRVHIERVIRRLREFRILKPHSVINHKHVNYLDEYVIIACGLINLQNALIKSTN